MKPVERIIFWGAVGLGGYVLYKTFNPDKYQPVNLPDTRPGIRKEEGVLVTPIPASKENSKAGDLLRKLGIGTGKRKQVKIVRKTAAQSINKTIDNL